MVTESQDCCRLCLLPLPQTSQKNLILSWGRKNFLCYHEQNTTALSVPEHTAFVFRSKAEKDLSILQNGSTAGMSCKRHLLAYCSCHRHCKHSTVAQDATNTMKCSAPGLTNWLHGADAHQAAQTQLSYPTSSPAPPASFPRVTGAWHLKSPALLPIPLNCHSFFDCFSTGNNDSS